MSDKKKIFIADDDRVVLDSLRKLLELSGFEVWPCDKAKEAFGGIKSFKPDLILLDLMMPSLGGLEICQMLNLDPQTQAIPIIVISGLSKEEDVKKAYRMGVIEYVTKPYDFTKLLQTINKALSYKDGKML